MTKRTDNMSLMKSSTRDKRGDIFRPSTQSLRNSFNHRRQTPVLLNPADAKADSMSHTYGTNILSDSSKKLNSDLGNSIQKIKNATPRNKLKHSIGTSARRNEDDPETISEHNAESLSRDNEADVENENEEEEEDGEDRDDGDDGNADEADGDEEEEDGLEDADEDDDDDEGDDGDDTIRDNTNRSSKKLNINSNGTGVRNQNVKIQKNVSKIKNNNDRVNT